MSKIKLVTHNSSFHADDIFAAACLKIYYEDIKNKKTKIIRWRDQKIIDSGDVVFDVLDLTEEERKEVYRATCQLAWNRINKAKNK